MVAKKHSLFIIGIIVLFGLVTLITKCSLERNGNWVYRDLKSRMNDVHFGDAITQIDINILRVSISFDIHIKPDYLTKIEIYQLGKNLINEIEDEYKRDASFKAAGLLFIYPVSDIKNEDFLFRRPTSERRWHFSGDLGDGQGHIGGYIDQLPDFED